MSKIVYVAHKISGDQAGNISKVLDIIKDINLNEPSIVPMAPYLVDWLTMTDGNAIELARSIANSHALIQSGCIDSLWLYGDLVSPGMTAEIRLALSCGISVHPKSEGTFEGFRAVREQYLREAAQAYLAAAPNLF